ncbi:enoyl-CoA hydratase/isomerase family protein [Nocardia terpenica]|uniref:Enoyl-CoA hydratase n=1 Tax=Nocardia terpenica TaxID=455432 RepID=A0A164PKM6_9NOCA|nr:enoyl-CoA hydratase/isomerase family protein [Nocardia terpenica]KZM75696.1 hypothetical protein AWN90_20335 [Nocardia terpenica]NQE86203.1 enoyl-CoA hydratase/isomerase family protein [Nocardia terpenica]
MSVLDIRRDGPVVTASLNNPPFNFLTAELVFELGRLLDMVEADPGVRAVVIASAVPDTFISHYDIAEILQGAERVGLSLGPRLVGVGIRAVDALRRIPGLRQALEHTPAAGITALLRYHDVTRRMRRSSAVFVAAVSGMALGGGCELALACDIRLMAEGPYGIGQPEVLLGLFPGGGGTQILTRTLGVGRAIQLVVEGKPLSPIEALEVGLVHRLVRGEELLDEAQFTAARLATRAPAAVEAIKRAVYHYGSRPIDKGLAFERARFLSLATRHDTKNALGTYVGLVEQHTNGGQGVVTFAEQHLPDLLAGTTAEFVP